MQEKVRKWQVKLAKVQAQRQEHSKKGNVTGDMRQYWEESILNQGEGEEEEELSPTGRLIEQLQAQHKALQVRTKTVEGMLKPLKKNLKTLQEEYQKYKDAFLKHDEKRKAVEWSNGELVRRRKAAEQKSQDFQNELNGISTKMAPLTSGPVDYNFLRGMKGIMDIMEEECGDPQLVADVREMIMRLNQGALSDSVDGLTDSPPRQPVTRRRGSLTGSSFSAHGNRSFSGAPRTPGSAQSGRRMLQKSLNDLTFSPGNGTQLYLPESKAKASRSPGTQSGRSRSPGTPSGRR